jgi:NADPH:quinone reductase-like Zn-dependent oxidoreductase
MTTATMDALIVHAPSRYSIERVPVPVPQPYEALYQVRAVAICGTDTHIINGDFPGFWPQALPTPGHEWADDIMALGQHSEQFGQAGKFVGPEEAEDYIAGTRSSTTSPRATSSAARCSPACSPSPRRSIRSARSAPGS